MVKHKADNLRLLNHGGKYIALNEAGKEIISLYEVLQAMDPQGRLPITLYEDNLGTI